MRTAFVPAILLATALACTIESERPPIPGDAGSEPADAASADTTVIGDAGAATDAAPAGPDAARPDTGPRPDTGIAETGADASLEQILAGVAPYTWVALPGSLMKDVCPGPYSSYPCVAVQTAWSGAAWDDAHDRLYVLGGGHGDSFYNMPFEYDLGALRWRRLGELPEGATGGKATAGMRYVPLETCGFYPKEPFSPPDGGMGVATNPQGYVAYSVCADPAFRAQYLDLQQPRSSHTYGKLLFDGERHRLCYLGGGYYPSAQGWSPQGFCFDVESGSWTETPPRAVDGRGALALDGKGNAWYAIDDSGKFAKLALSTWTWTTFGGLNYNAGGSADVDRKRQHLVILRKGSDGAPALLRFDLQDAAALQKSPPFTTVTASGELPALQSQRPGFVYADDRDQFFAWSGGQAVWSLDPATSTWTRHACTGDDPGAELNNGTYGRFRYSARYRALVLVNGADRPVHVLKLP